MTTTFALYLGAVCVLTAALVYVLCKMFHDIAGSDDDIGGGS